MAQKLLSAADNGNAAACQEILSRAASAEERSKSLFATDVFDFTALMIAARGGHDDVARTLLSHTSGDEQKSKLLLAGDSASGRAALHHAAENGNGSVAAVLLSAASSDEERRKMLLARSIAQRTPLHLAADGCSEAVARALLSSAPGDTDRRNMFLARLRHGYTALHWAADNCHDASAQVLLSHVGGDETKAELLLAEEKSGKTALHVAVCNGHEVFSRTLLSNVGTDEVRGKLLRADREGKTASDLAEQHETLKKLLSEYMDGPKGAALKPKANYETGPKDEKDPAPELKFEKEEEGPNEEKEPAPKKEEAPKEEKDPTPELKVENEEKGPKEEKEPRAKRREGARPEEGGSTKTREGVHPEAEREGGKGAQKREGARVAGLGAALNRWGADIANALSGTHTFFPKGFVPQHGAEECLQRLVSTTWQPEDSASAKPSSRTVAALAVSQASARLQGQCKAEAAHRHDAAPTDDVCQNTASSINEEMEAWSPSVSPASTEVFLWKVHLVLVATPCKLALDTFREAYSEYHGRKCVIGRFLVVGGGLVASMRRIPDRLQTAFQGNAVRCAEATQRADAPKPQFDPADAAYCREPVKRRNDAAMAKATAGLLPNESAAPTKRDGGHQHQPQ